MSGKLLAGDPSIDSLIANNPFKDKPPKYLIDTLLYIVIHLLKGTSEHCTTGMSIQRLEALKLVKETGGRESSLAHTYQ